jgi:hypothetical protein
VTQNRLSIVPDSDCEAEGLDLRYLRRRQRRTARITRVMKKRPRTTPRTGPRYEGVLELVATGVGRILVRLLFPVGLGAYGNQSTILEELYLVPNIVVRLEFVNPVGMGAVCVALPVGLPPIMETIISGTV